MKPPNNSWSFGLGPTSSKNNRSTNNHDARKASNTVLIRVILIMTVLGGSWVVMNGVISPLIGVLTIVTLSRSYNPTYNYP